MKQARRDPMVIGFSTKDFAGVLQPHTDALVVTLIIANHNVHCILVDNGSLADILYWSAFKKLNLEQEKIVQTSCPLIGLTGEQVQLLESIELPVTVGTLPKQATIMVCFLLVDRPLAYNVVIERAALNKFRAVTSTPHFKMKFSTDHRVGEVRAGHLYYQVIDSLELFFFFFFFFFFFATSALSITIPFATFTIVTILLYG
jgi:hypothetical protein